MILFVLAELLVYFIYTIVLHSFRFLQYYSFQLLKSIVIINTKPIFQWSCELASKENEISSLGALNLNLCVYFLSWPTYTNIIRLIWGIRILCTCWLWSRRWEQKDCEPTCTHLVNDKSLSPSLVCFQWPFISYKIRHKMRWDEVKQSYHFIIYIFYI